MSSRRYTDAFRDILGFESWKVDACRHTFSSMLLALKENPEYVAFQMGSSPRMIDHHYRCLVTRETAERFWNIKPQPLATLLASNDPHAEKVDITASVRNYTARLNQINRKRQSPTAEGIQLARALADFGQKAAKFATMAGEDASGLQAALKGLRAVVAVAEQSR